MRSTLLILCAAITTTACSSSSSGGDSTTDAGSDTSTADSSTNDGAMAHDSAAVDASDSSVDDASEAGGACNTLANVAQPVTIEQVAALPPAPQGGTFVDGTYVLTDFTAYTGADGQTGPEGTTQITLQVSGDTFQVVSDDTPTTRTVSVVVSGTNVTATDTCPDAMVFDERFTATATGFVIYLGADGMDAGGPTLAETFTKQ